ncbi:transporter protein smf2 [Metarhizium guizhouense ARSEF 977]|uniref:Transporter protein smf2 n=1 Tax=Metarhizium guizhouense (strain ARSEF 977) TaxID=1276136 RepID=A0A0B4ICZ2_METGA|nr:transporter protein smf2 [Metarhizium guizhouense ARSEF 977]
MFFVFAAQGLSRYWVTWRVNSEESFAASHDKQSFADTLQKKPYSAVTVTIENLTSESYAEEDLSGIPDLVEVIKLQASGPAEAARAIRKKLKYGTVHRQIRALVLLDGLIQNAGSQFQRALADEPLLERLRVCGSSNLSDPAVKKKCRELFQEWTQYANVPGLERVARLYRELPKRKVGMKREESKVIQETENPFGDDEEEEAERASEQKKQDMPGPSGGYHSATALDMQDGGGGGSSGLKKSKAKSKSKSKSKSGRKFDLEAEMKKMKSVIADASMASTALMNSLQTINREKERISDNRAATQHFEACKQLRRRILRYIHQVESEQWLGALLHANDELVDALMAYEQLDHSMEADSDSDDELAEQTHMYRMITEKAQEGRAAAKNVPDLSGLTIDTASKHAPARPPRPVAPTRRLSSATSEDAEEEEEDDDDDNPFGDKNVISTPAAEQGEPRW